eukprot:SAG11_NODE_19692_length_461_cov_0.709945_1_plen_64_part_10
MCMPPSPTELLEGACIFGGLIALGLGLVLGHSSPIFAHSDLVAAPLLEVAKGLPHVVRHILNLV